MNVPIFAQRDPKYKGYVLDDSPYSFWDFGCALCSVSMVAKYYGKDTDPIKLDSDLSKIGGIDNQGLMHWNKVSELYSDISCDVVNYGNDPANMAQIDEALNNNFPVIVETRFGQDETAMHYVVLTKKNGVYTANDPWWGDSCSFNERYGEPSRWIYLAIFYKGTAGNQTVAVLKDTFEELVRKSTIADSFIALGYDDPAKIKQKLSEVQVEIDGLNREVKTLKEHLTAIAITLQTTDSPSDILGAITRLIGIEDIKNNLEKEISNCKIDIEEFKRDKERLTIQYNDEKEARLASVDALKRLEKEKSMVNTFIDKLNKMYAN